VSMGTELLLKWLFLKFLLTRVTSCILGTMGAGPQRLCVCMCYYIHLSVQSSWVPKQSCWCWLAHDEISFLPDFRQELQTSVYADL